MGLETVELVISIESAFSMRIPDEVAATLTTPERASNHIEMTLRQEGRARPRTEIDRIVKELTLGISGIDPSHYTPEKEFVRDFGLD